ncbi:MAG: hypothetical protein Q9191_003287 [Dirinaria sp. TL-2023a]
MDYDHKLFFTVTIIINSFIFLTSSLNVPSSLPLTPNLSSPSLPLNASALNSSNQFDSSEITGLLRTLRLTSEISLNQAKLKMISFNTLTRQPSSDIADFIFVTPLFEAGGAHPKGESNAFTYSRSMSQLAQWIGPDFFGMDPKQLAALHEVAWTQVQALMNVEEAAAILKNTGRKQVIYHVQLLQSSNYPLGYAFTLLDPSWSTYLVSITTRKVRQIL